MGLENAGLENDGQTFSKLWAQLRGLEMQEYKSSWVQPTHTVYIKEAIRNALQSSTGMSSHLQLSVFRTSGATAALLTSVIVTNYCWHIAYKECCNFLCISGELS